MPRKLARGAGETTETTTDPGEAALEESVEEAAAELEAVAQQLPEGARGSLQRFGEGGVKEWCEDLAAAEFSPARVRAKWGAGSYVVYWRTPDPKRRGKTVGAGSTRFILAPGLEDPAPGSAKAGPASVVADLVMAHTKQMLDGQQMLQQMQMAVLKNLTEPRRDSELTEKLLLALIAKSSPDTELLKALLTRKSEGLDLAGALALADKLASRTSPTATMKETLELLGAARELAGEGEATPAWMRLAAGALDTIGKAVAGRAVAPTQVVETTIEGGQPAPAPAAPSTLPAGQEVPALPPTAHALFHFLAPHMPALLRHAKADHDPATYAGVIFDQLQPEYYTEVRDYISRPDFLELLEGHFGEIRGQVVDGSNPPVPVRQWFTELRDDLVERIAETLEPPPATEVH